MADCWVYLQVSVIDKITHSSVRSYMLILNRGVNLWLLRQLLSLKALSNLPPPVFLRNYHHAQPKFMSVSIGSDLRYVSITGFWDSYYRPTDQILPDIPPPDFARNHNEAKPTFISVGVDSDIINVSIADCWDIYYLPNPPSIFQHLFSCGILIRHNPQFCLLE